MSLSIGIAFAIIALISWAIADFSIQRTTRVIGVWRSLFYIGTFGCIFLSPFIWKNILAINVETLLLFLPIILIALFATLFDFEALKEGKIAIIEPLLGIELPITVGLSMLILHEKLSLLQGMLIASVFIGIVMVITTNWKHIHYHKRLFEKGVIFAGAGAVATAVMNFLVGYQSQTSGPLFTIWMIHTIIGIACFLVMLIRKETKTIVQDLKKHRTLILIQSGFDTLAWVTFAVSTTLIPISIATTISESYIAFAAMLGIFINHEKLKKHQIFGIVIAIVSVIVLASITTK